MNKFLRKFENRRFKISRVNSILITKYINLVIYSNFVVLRNVVIEGDFLRIFH